MMASNNSINTSNHNSNNSNGNDINHQLQPQQITGTSLDEPADCTIACDEGHITAHKLLLCDHSKYLHDILSKYPTAEHPIIILTDLNIIDIKTLVNYMYTGELIITNDSSPTSLLRAAQILKIDSLTDDDREEDAENIHHVTNGDDEDEDDEIVDDGLIDDDDIDMDQYSPEHLHSINNLLSNDTQRLINSIKNIYSLEQPLPSLGPSTPGSSSGNSHSSQQQLAKLEFGSNIIGNHTNLNLNLNNNITSNITGNSNNNTLADLQDFQDSKQIDNKNNKIRCHLCKIGLSDVKCLYRHVLTRHLPQKWGYKCEFCDREFSRDDHLMRHYTTKHKNMEFNREKIRETRRLNREMAKNFHDQISTV